MKRLIGLIVIILIAFQGISQPGTDTTKVPNKQLISAIKDIEAGDICKEENKILTQKVDSAIKIIILQDSSIYLYNKKETAYKKIINNYIKSDAVVRKESQEYFTLYGESEKKLASEKKKTRRAYIYGGILLIVSAFILK